MHQYIHNVELEVEMLSITMVVVGSCDVSGSCRVFALLRSFLTLTQIQIRIAFVWMCVCSIRVCILYCIQLVFVVSVLALVLFLLFANAMVVFC